MQLCHACKNEVSEVFHLGEFRLCSECMVAGRLRELLRFNTPAVAQTVNGTGRSGPIVDRSGHSRQ
jgi:hypothetical protein